MSDPIDRQAAIDALCDNCDNVQAVCAHYPCKQYIAVEKLQSAEPDVPDRNAGDLISRQAAIDAPKKFTKDCNPDHYFGHQKFIEYMENAEIGSFGNWQLSNGFNLGLKAAEVAIKELPSAERKKSK